MENGTLVQREIIADRRYGKVQLREHAEASETGGDGGVGCVGQVICVYPCVPQCIDSGSLKN